jgi:hypothetical protein
VACIADSTNVSLTQRFRKSLQDVRVRRGTDVAMVHHVLKAKMKLKLKDLHGTY